MYYLVNPQDGERVGGVEIRDASEAPPGSVIVEEIPPDRVWDAASKSLRLRTTGELLAELKRQKRRDLLLAFKADYALIWMIDDISVEEWKDRISFKAAANRTAAENAKLTQAAALFDKLQTKLVYLRDPVRTEAEVNALSWTSTP